MARGRGIPARLALLVLASGIHCSVRQPRPPVNAGVGRCSEAAPLPCEAACFAGDGAACFIFGQAVAGVADAPVRLPQDLPRGERALEKGCQLANLDACRELVSYQTDRAAPGADCVGWEDLCKRGNQRSCTFLGQCLAYVEHFRRDRPQARRLFEEGCARGERVACRELGFLSLNGTTVPDDEARGFALLDRACRLDDPLACASEGRLLETGRGTPADLARAKTLYRQSCARGIRPIPCEALRRLGEVPPRSAVSSGDAVESVHANAVLGYDLRLPANWEFVPPDGVPFSDALTASERVAARPRGGGPSSDTLILAVTDYVVIIPGQYHDQEPSTFDELEAEATGWLARHGLTKDATSRTRFFGHDAVRIDARVDRPGAPFLTLVLFRKDRRRFELRCLSSQRPPDMPCADAFGSLEIHAPNTPPQEVGRVLHLRERRTGLSFDAPDDRWLAFGPRSGFAGREQVWVWLNAGRQIDVGVLELPRDADAGIENAMASELASHFTAEGAIVTTNQSTLDQQPCVHLSIDGKLGAQDFFIRVRGSFAYSVLVTTPSRSADLLDRVRGGVHFIPVP